MLPTVDKDHHGEFAADGILLQAIEQLLCSRRGEIVASLAVLDETNLVVRMLLVVAVAARFDNVACRHFVVANRGISSAGGQ